MDDGKPPVAPLDTLFRAVFDAAPTPLLLVANDPPRFTMVAVNRVHAAAFRTTTEALTGYGVFEVFPAELPPDVQEFVDNIRRSFEAVLSSGAPHQMPVKPFPVVDAAGQPEERYWSAVNAPVRGPDGAITHIISSVRDMTGEVRERRAEDARSLLMREVDHRARNALTVVQSIVRLTDARDLSEFKTIVTGRVDALARAQTSLARRRWEGGDLREVIEQELVALGLTDKVTLDGAHVLLSADQVQAMSMSLHELATNARKYGGLSTTEGRVAVEWSLPRPDRLVLSWREAGGPAVRPPEATGFGYRLVHRLASQLGGQVCYDWRPEGLVVTFEAAV